MMMSLMLVLTFTATGEDFVSAIEQAHGYDAWHAQPAVASGVTVKFGDQTMVEGAIVFDTPVGRSRIQSADGAVMVFDGSTAWSSPATPMTRFHVLTWPYFLAAPFKLSDPGVNIEALGDLKLDERTLPAAKMTFDAGTGDTPDDWYILFRDPKANRLVGMAYIVTYGGKSVDEAENEIHAVTYEDFQRVDGVLLPTIMRFWNWDEQQGIVGESLGTATFTEPHFVQPAVDAFARPAGAEEDPLPGS